MTAHRTLKQGETLSPLEAAILRAGGMPLDRLAVEEYKSLELGKCRPPELTYRLNHWVTEKTDDPSLLCNSIKVLTGALTMISIFMILMASIAQNNSSLWYVTVGLSIVALLWDAFAWKVLAVGVRGPARWKGYGLDNYKGAIPPFVQDILDRLIIEYPSRMYIRIEELEQGNRRLDPIVYVMPYFYSDHPAELKSLPFVIWKDGKEVKLPAA